MATRGEFQEWRESLVTQEMFKEIDRQISESAEYLTYNAGQSREEDLRIVGVIAGLRAVKNITFEGEDTDA